MTPAIPEQRTHRRPVCSNPRCGNPCVPRVDGYATSGGWVHVCPSCLLPKRSAWLASGRAS